MRELVHLPGQHNKTHHRAKKRNGLTNKEQAVIARSLERSKINGKGAEETWLRLGGGFRHRVGRQMSWAVLLLVHLWKYNVEAVTRKKQPPESSSPQLPERNSSDRAGFLRACWRGHHRQAGSAD